MLIITRRIFDSLVIGDESIIVTILGIRGNQVRLGVEAPKEISVHREEIFHKIKQEKNQNYKEFQSFYDKWMSEKMENQEYSNNLERDILNDQ